MSTKSMFTLILVATLASLAMSGVSSERSSRLSLEPPGSGWAQQLATTHPSHPFTLQLKHTGPHHVDAGATPALCPNSSWSDAVAAAGLLSVELFGAVGDRSVDSSPAVRAAINASLDCGGCVFFPPGEYLFNSTLLITHGCFKGSAAGGGVDGSSPPQVNIYGPANGPVIALIKADSVMIQDLSFHGEYTGIYIGDSAGVRFVNCGASAGKDGDSIDASAGGCNKTACNVVLGSMSAAMVIENSFWLWFERCAFTDQGNSGVCAHPYKLPCDWGQRPTVIMRGQYNSRAIDMNLTPVQGGVPGVYLVRFDTAIFTGGGVQYQQLRNDTGGSPTGWMDFVSCCLEAAATPLLDLQSDPAIQGYWPGLEQIIIRDYMDADSLVPHFGAGDKPVVSINCSLNSVPDPVTEPRGPSGCSFDGLSIESAGLPPGQPAVRVYAGTVTATTIVAASSQVYSELNVVDQHGLPKGEWKQTSGAGWLMSGPSKATALQFLPEGAKKPSRVIYVSCSVPLHLYLCM